MSKAFKFTRAGEIDLRLAKVDGQADKPIRLDDRQSS